ncbi:hypothetical protein ACWA6H_21325 [Pseudomonas bijieensis]
MTVHKITAPEGDLLNVLYEVSPLEWRKYQQRYPEIRVANSFQKVDRSGYPPYISFRFVVESDVVIAKLRLAVESYLGKVSWSLIEHKRDGLSGRNWTIKPRRVREIGEEALKLGLAPDEYFAEYEPKFGVTAYDDLVGLTEHIRQAFSEDGRF